MGTKLHHFSSFSKPLTMEFNSKASTLFLALVFLAFFHLSLVSCRKIISSHGGNGFTLDLIHRDSPLSPLYNSSRTSFERLQNAFHRSFSRASFFKKHSVNGIRSTITPTPGEYLMKISIGTPSLDTLAVADTGSDLTWIQCEPCFDCFKQLEPIFNPKNSSSYKTVGCHNKLCREVGHSCKNNTCNYEVTYGDQSHTIGDVSFETFKFASTSSKSVSIPNIAFGCGHSNTGTFRDTTSGIIGLGGGEASIINQLDKYIKGKFSYCLIPLELSTSNLTSHINFGSNAIVSGRNVVSTPLIRGEPSTFYYLNLEGVSVGSKRLEFKSSKIGSSSIGGDEGGNIVIDCGTTLTYLPNDFYLNLESTLVHVINATRKDDPSGTFRLCYESEDGTIDAPMIVAHFTNADLELSPSSTFAEVERGLVCMTIVPAYQIAIFGNLAQENFLIGYDLVANKVSFKPTDCTKY